MPVLLVQPMLSRWLRWLALLCSPKAKCSRCSRGGVKSKPVYRLVPFLSFDPKCRRLHMPHNKEQRDVNTALWQVPLFVQAALAKGTSNWPAGELDAHESELCVEGLCWSGCGGTLWYVVRQRTRHVICYLQDVWRAPLPQVVCSACMFSINPPHQTSVPSQCLVHGRLPWRAANALCRTESNTKLPPEPSFLRRVLFFCVVKGTISLRGRRLPNPPHSSIHLPEALARQALLSLLCSSSSVVFTFGLEIG